MQKIALFSLKIIGFSHHFATCWTLITGMVTLLDPDDCESEITTSWMDFLFQIVFRMRPVRYALLFNIITPNGLNIPSYTSAAGMKIVLSRSRDWPTHVFPTCPALLPVLPSWHSFPLSFTLSVDEMNCCLPMKRCSCSLCQSPAVQLTTWF